MIDYPLYFFIRKEVFEANLPRSLNDNWSGLGSWDHALHMISLALQDQGVPCQTTCNISSEGVVIAHPQSIGTNFRFPDQTCFICYQGDWPRCIWADAHIVINQYQLSGPNLTLADHLFGVGPLLHLPFIPEPSLIPRSPQRGNRFEQIAYLGTSYNLLPELQTPEWKKRLASIGLNFLIQEDPAQHADYSAIDCIVAVRPKHRNPHQKPPNKLWNAWRAGVPAILGIEAGFQEKKISDLDYIEADTPDDVYAALVRLKRSPELVRQMTTNGLQRSKECTPDKIVAQWIEALQDPIQAIWHRKQRQTWSHYAQKQWKSLRAKIRQIRTRSR